MLKGLFNLILIGLIFLSCVAFTFYKLEDPEFLIEQARKVNLYGRISNQFDVLIPESTFKQSPLDKNDSKEVLAYAIDGQTFYDFLDKYLTFELNWLTGKTSDYNFHYDLTAVRNRAQEKYTEILNAKYDDLPVCQSNQLRTWSATKTLPACQLSDSSNQADVTAMLANQSSTFFTGTNEKGEPLVPTGINMEKPSQKQLSSRSNFANFTKALYAVWMMTLGFLLLYLLIFRKRAFWSLAFIFIIVGLLQIAFSFVAWGYLAKSLADLLTGTPVAQTSAIITDIIGVTMEVLKTIMGTLSIYTLATGGVMLLLAIYNMFKKPKILPV